MEDELFAMAQPELLSRAGGDMSMIENPDDSNVQPGRGARASRSQLVMKERRTGKG